MKISEARTEMKKQLNVYVTMLNQAEQFLGSLPYDCDESTWKQAQGNVSYARGAFDALCMACMAIGYDPAIETEKHTGICCYYTTFTLH